MKLLQYSPYMVLATVLSVLAGCASTSPPSRPENLCDILHEKPQWHKALLETQEKWRVPPQVLMAMMYQESAFRHDAKPPKDYLLGIIPWGRVSSAYGYSQAKDEVWSDYTKQSDRFMASRSDFSDAVDFMGWYMDKSQKINGVSKWDAYAQYLNYHEGWGGYSRQSHQNKTWLLNVAQKVKNRADTYGSQYQMCKSSL